MVKSRDSEFVLAVVPFGNVLQSLHGRSVLYGTLRSHGIKLRSYFLQWLLHDISPMILSLSGKE